MTEEKKTTSSDDQTGQGDQRAWKSPELTRVGKLKDFVQAGNAFGKSGDVPDGASSPGGEKHRENL